MLVLLHVAAAQAILTAPLPPRPGAPLVERRERPHDPRLPQATNSWSQVTRAVLGDDGKFGECESRSVGQPPELVLNQCAMLQHVPPEATVLYRRGFAPGPIVFVFETIQEFDGQAQLPRFSELEGFREIKREVYRLTVGLNGVPKCASEIFRGVVPIYWLPPCTDGTRYIPAADAAGKPRIAAGRVTMLVTTDGKPVAPARRR